MAVGPGFFAGRLFSVFTAVSQYYMPASEGGSEGKDLDSGI